MKWRRRFTDLFAAGIIKSSYLPGREFTLQIPGPPFCNEPNRVAVFCRERLGPHGQVSPRVCFDLSAVRVEDFSDWLSRFMSQVTVDNRALCDFSVSAVHPGLPVLLEVWPRYSGAGLLLRYERDFIDQQSWPAVVTMAHRNPRIALVPSGTGQLLNGLHGREHGCTAMPLGLFEAPADTAWCLLELNAERLGNPQQLRGRIAASLRFADNLLDELQWSRPSLQLDALLNRRIAIHVCGIGNLLADSARQPGTAGVFMGLRRWLSFLRRCLMHESLLLARQRGPFPGLGVREFIEELTPYYGADQADRIVRHRCLRHRHLLALSPFAVFPTEFNHVNEGHYLSLLPVLSCADVVSMRGIDSRKKLSANGWRQLLELTVILGAASAGIAHNDWR